MHCWPHPNIESMISRTPDIPVSAVGKPIHVALCTRTLIVQRSTCIRFPTAVVHTQPVGQASQCALDLGQCLHLGSGPLRWAEPAFHINHT